MSKDALAALDRLLFKSDQPIVVALVGGWGEGKTYFWKNGVLPQHTSTRPKPGYVSVFGADTLASIRERVVIATSDQPDIGWLRKAVSAFTTWGRNALNHWGAKILISDSIAVELLQSIALKPHWIICIDDVERLSSNIGFEKFLGYVCELRDKWQLKVVLIFNREPLDEDQDSDFHRYQEKVIDRVIPFSLDYATICSFQFKDLTIGGASALADVQAKTAILGLRNIRLLGKVRSYFKEVAQELGPHAHPDFLRSALSSILLFVFIRFSNQKPSGLTFELLAGYSEWMGRLRKSAVNKKDDEKQDSAEHAVATDLLTRFGYSSTDDMDRVLMEFVRSDVLDAETLLAVHATQKDEKVRLELGARMHKVWDLYYHGTLANNAETLCNAVEEVLPAYLPYIPPGELDFALQVLSVCNRAAAAKEYLDEFKRLRGAVFEKLTPESMPYGRFEYAPLKEYLSMASKRGRTDNRSLEEVMATAFDESYVRSEDSDRIVRFSADDLVSYFMTHDQLHLTTKLRMLTKDTNAMVRQNAFVAAEQIAETSPLNHMRMLGMGLLRNEAGDPVEPAESQGGS